MTFIHNELYSVSAYIHLLQIFTGDDDEDLSCEVDSYNFHTEPQEVLRYAAVSYTWGPA